MEGHQNSSAENRNPPEDSSIEDLKLLIDCIKYQKDDGYQEQALKTIASLCHISEDASDYLVRSDGLECIMKIIFNTTSSNLLKVESLHILCEACENNALVQQMLCDPNFFAILKIFLTMNSNPVLQTLSGYLLICLATNNEKGQVLARTSKCLETLRYLFKDVCSPTCSPRNRNRMLAILANESAENEILISVWQTAVNVLSVCVNNPQNNENQLYCASVFPAAVAYLRNTKSSTIQATTLSFITNCLANNNRTQVNFRMVGGLRVVSEILSSELSRENQLSSQVLNNVVLAVEAAVRGNKICRDSAAEVGIVPLLLRAIQLCFTTPKFKVECLITISACIERCVPNCLAFEAHDGMAIIVKLMAENLNCDEVQKAATFVLNTYMAETKSLASGSPLKKGAILDGTTLAKAACRKNNNVESSPTDHDISQIAKQKDSDVKHKLCRECGSVVNKDGDNDNSVLAAITTEDDQCGSVKNQIKDSTDGVQFLNQPFTNKEDARQSLVDVVNAGCNCKVITLPQSDSTMKDSDNNARNTDSLPTTDTTAVHGNHSHLSNHTSTADNHTSTSKMVDSNLSSSAAIEQEKSHLRGNTGINPTSESANMEQSHCNNDMPTARDNNKQCDDQSSHQLLKTSMVTDNTRNAFPQSHSDAGINTVVRSKLASTELSSTSHHENTEAKSGSFLDNTLFFHSSAEHSQDEEILPQTVLQGSQANGICDPASEISDVGDVITETSYPASTEYEYNIDETSVVNIRYGETPDKQTTVLKNKRPHKRSSSTVMGESHSCSIKRAFHMPVEKMKRNALANVIIEETSMESSSDECMVNNNDDEEREEISTKTPIAINRMNTRSLQKRKRRKLFASKCLGCCGDFSQLNSRNFLSKLRSNSHTCSRHCDLVKQISSALRSYKNVLKTIERSPNFDFIPSPKMNASDDESPTEILKKFKRKRKISSSKVPFTVHDVEILKKGYNMYGPRWSLIERNCKFSVRRTSKTLKQKFEGISKSVVNKKKIPFSSQEEKNVRNGVSKFGYSWAQILNRYAFNESRSAQSLKDKWRNLTKYIKG